MDDGPGRLLIVDDNKLNRLLLSRNVEMLGHQADLAEDGAQAMARLKAQAYDLLLLDIEMPVMDGFEVLEALKADPALRDLPVIVTSSVEGLGNIVRCIELGAEDYLPKPVNQTLLKARLSSGLEKKRLRDEQKALLKRFATEEVARDLQEQGFAIGGRRVTASVLFCDIRGFTALCARQSPEASIALLNAYYDRMFGAITAHGGIVTLMIGDGLMAVFGAPQPLENSAQSAVGAARDMRGGLQALNAEQRDAGKPEIDIGIGIATGDMIAGYAGTEARASYTCIGETVNLAARLESYTKTAQKPVLMDGATSAALTDKTGLDPVPDVALKGFALRSDIRALSL